MWFLHLPPTGNSSSTQLYLQAANCSPTATFGRKSLTLYLGLRRSLPWIFVIAEIDKPLLGADFLHHFHLSVDLNKRTLVDNTTKLTIAGILITSISQQPTIPPLPDPPNEFTALLAQYPQLTQPHNFSEQPAKHNITHAIVTTGQPVTMKARHTSPERLCSAKKEFQHMESFNLPRAHGLSLYTWFQRNSVTGDHAETIVVWTKWQHQINTPSHICMTFRPLFKATQFSPSWTWLELTIIFPSQKMTFPRWL